jgi:hypothetical protein
MEIARLPSETEIMTALCCGERCRAKPEAPCHRQDFASETHRVKMLIERCSQEVADAT